MQAEAAAKYGEELRTEAQQASSFIYHLKRFNNWVKATVRVPTAMNSNVIHVLVPTSDSESGTSGSDLARTCLGCLAIVVTL